MRRGVEKYWSQLMCSGSSIGTQAVVFVLAMYLIRSELSFDLF